MTIKIRKQIYLEPAQETILKQMSGASGLSEAELIRQAIERHIRHLQQPARDRQAWEIERDYIMQRMIEGSQNGGRSWRREDLYER
jgi:hypothetical protein